MILNGAGNQIEINFRVSWFEKFEEIFLKDPPRFKVIAKGRRVGFTYHCVELCVEECLLSLQDGKPRKILWGDTTHENIVRYVERYFMPLLHQIPPDIIPWRYWKTEKKLVIADSVIDFRSADKPENWEGFGYDLVILNEAGIILKNRYLWENAVRPMLLDSPNSRAIIGGVPKGKNLFWELWEKANSGELGKDWKAYRLTTYDNPRIPPEEIEAMKREIGDERIIRQEIYGEFVGGDELYLLDYEKLIQATQTDHGAEGLEVWGLDVGLIHDEAVLVKRRGRCVYEVKSWKGLRETTKLAEAVKEEYLRSSVKPYKVYVDTIGIGWGVADILREYGIPSVHANFAEKSLKPNLTNKRAEAYWRLKEELEKGGLRIPNDSKLIEELSNITYEHDGQGRIKIVDKEALKKVIGRSPDRADALALTFFEELPFTAEVQREQVIYTKLPKFEAML